jgi:hypothetical protein
MKKSVRKSLVLSRETLRALDIRSGLAVGGSVTVGTTCDATCNTALCTQPGYTGCGSEGCTGTCTMGPKCPR